MDGCEGLRDIGVPLDQAPQVRVAMSNLKAG